MLTAAAIVILGMVLLHHRALVRAIRPDGAPSPRLSRYPSLTMIRPIRGLDVGAAENARALLDSEYPGLLEVLFVFDDADDPACPVVLRELARHRGRGKILFAGTPPPGRTGKLNAMMLGLAQARGELIGFSDSDTRPPPELVRRSVELLMTAPGAGDVFVPVAVVDRARRAGDVAYALLQNAWYRPSVERAAAANGALPFIMGQLMIWKREALDAIGGLECADGQLVDDMYLGQRVAATAWRNVMSRDRLPIATGGMTIGQFTHVFRRWLLFSQSGLPLAFTMPQWLRGAEFWLSLIVLALALWLRQPWAAVVAGVAAAASTASQVSLVERYGGAPVPLRYWWVPFTLPLVAPMLVLLSLVHRRVDWRGRPYTLDAHARLG